MQMAARFLLEKSVHPERGIFFLALTYEDSFLPSVGFDRSHIDGFLDRLRKSCARKLDGLTFRYLLVSEYGDLDKRQHFHFLAMTSRAVPYTPPIIDLGNGYKVYSNAFVQFVRECWPYGHVDDGGTPSAAAVMYTTGYALKEDDFSCVHEDELRELWCWEHHKYGNRNGKAPKHLARLKPYIPFRRYSLKPGLGLDDATIRWVYDYVRNDGENFRFNIDLGGGFVVPVPGIYINKFSNLSYGSHLSYICTQIRKRSFENEQQETLSEAFERCPDSSLARSVRLARIKKRKDEKLQKALSQSLNIYRHEI